MAYRSDRRPAQVDLHGWATLPLVDRIRLDGQSDCRFENYFMKASGTHQFPFMKSRLNYEAELKPDSFTWRFWWETPQGIVTVILETPDASLLSETEIQREVRRVYEQSQRKQGIPPPSKNEQEIIGKVQPRTEPPPVPLPLPSNGPVPLPGSNKTNLLHLCPRANWMLRGTAIICSRVLLASESCFE